MRGENGQKGHETSSAAASALSTSSGGTIATRDDEEQRRMDLADNVVVPVGVVSELDGRTGCDDDGDIEQTCIRDGKETTTTTGQACDVQATKRVDAPNGGGAAWLNCAGAAVSFVSSFGIVNAYGVFQSYYKQTRLDAQNDSVIALIGAIQLFCIYGAGPMVGKVFDSFGVFPLVPLGSFCIVLGMMMVSLAEVNQTYQYFLAQAVLFGLGCAMVFTPGLALMGHYFTTRRPLALGFVAAGSSVGGVIYPILLQRLIPRIGFPWAVRTLAFIALACLAFSCATMRTRLPLRKTTRAELLRVVDWGGFRDPRYCLATASAFVTFYAIFIPYFYIQQYARLRGMDESLAIYLLPLINAPGVPARILPGLLAPRLGVVNLMIFFTSTAGILILALWLPSSNDASILAFAVLYGFFSGPFISLVPAYVGIISPQPVYGARLGTLYLVVAVACLVGTPTGGALVGQTADLTHFHHLIGFSGALVLTGAVILCLIWVVECRMMLRRRRTSDDMTIAKRPLRLHDFRF